MSDASWNPTLRRVREGWGTLCVAYASEVKSLGHPLLPTKKAEITLPHEVTTVLASETQSQITHEL
jgi:hypothetical protein